MRLLDRLSMKVLRRRSFPDYLRKLGVQVGEDSKIAKGTQFGSEPYLVALGNHVSISGNVAFITHESEWVIKGLDSSYEGVAAFGRITVGNNVLIGYGTTILRGVTIGDNTIIGAHSLVNRSCEPNSVYAGVPARRICSIEDFAQRFREEAPPFDPENFKRDKRDEVIKIADRSKAR